MNLETRMIYLIETPIISLWTRIVIHAGIHFIVSWVNNGVIIMPKLIVAYVLIDPRANDYLGLIFIGGDQQPAQFTMYTTSQVDHPEKQFKISVTSDGMEWVMNAIQG